MKEKNTSDVSVVSDRIITICMDVFGIDRQIDVDFDYYFSFLDDAYLVIDSAGVEKSRLMFNIMIGGLSQMALHLEGDGWSSLSDDKIAEFDHDCYIATLMGNLLHVAPAYIKADWDFDAAIAEIDCPCCGEKLCSTSSK